MATLDAGSGANSIDPRPGPFVRSGEIVVADADRSLAALFEAIVRAAPAVDDTKLLRLGRLAEAVAQAFGARRDRVGRALVPRDAAIDVAAELVECADELVRSGCVLEAFAFEGIEGRIIESLVGSGTDATGSQQVPRL